MLAIGMYYSYDYKDIDLFKVIIMLAIHETEEAVIGDITMFQKKVKNKEKEGHKAVHKIFGKILSAPALEQLILEFDAGETKEAKFAYRCDKLECDLQAKIYGDNDCVDLDNQEKNKSAHDPRVKALLDKGLNFGKMWLQFGQNIYNYDENFLEVSNYAMTHSFKIKTKTPKNRKKSV